MPVPHITSELFHNSPAYSISAMLLHSVYRIECDISASELKSCMGRCMGFSLRCCDMAPGRDRMATPWTLQKYRGVVHPSGPSGTSANHSNYTKYSTCVPMSHRFSVTVRINLGSISSRSLPFVSGTNSTTNIRPKHEMSAYSQNAPCSPSPSCLLVQKNTQLKRLMRNPPPGYPPTSKSTNVFTLRNAQK